MVYLSSNFGLVAEGRTNYQIDGQKVMHIISPSCSLHRWAPKTFCKDTFWCFVYNLVDFLPVQSFHSSLVIIEKHAWHKLWFGLPLVWHCCGCVDRVICGCCIRGRSWWGLAVSGDINNSRSIVVLSYCCVTFWTRCDAHRCLHKKKKQTSIEKANTVFIIFFFSSCTTVINIVMCQRGGVSDKQPWLRAATRHRPGILWVH